MNEEEFHRRMYHADKIPMDELELRDPFVVLRSLVALGFGSRLDTVMVAKGRILSEKEQAAINYLHDEWDYSVEYLDVKEEIL